MNPLTHHTVLFVILCLIAVVCFLVDYFSNPPKRFMLIGLAAIALALLTGCENMTPAQRAGAQSLRNIAQVAVNAVAAHYGGTEAAKLASDGLSALGAVAQAYSGGKIPAEILNASPGVQGVGVATQQLIEPNHVVNQATVDQINQVAKIAKTLSPTVVVPTSP